MIKDEYHREKRDNDEFYDHENNDDDDENEP